MKFLLRISLAALLAALAAPAAAQPSLTPDCEKACDPATASSLPLIDAVVGGGGPTVRLVSGDDITIRRAG